MGPLTRWETLLAAAVQNSKSSFVREVVGVERISSPVARHAEYQSLSRQTTKLSYR